jgi:NADP-reducing hydrogenase subunit HndB
MMTISELNNIKAKTKAAIDDGKTTRIVVGMATCGLAAGAASVTDAFKAAIKEKKLKNVTVGQAGCLGMCKLEPLAEVYVPGKEKITYVKLTADMAKRIVDEHIAAGKVVNEYVVGNE